MQDDFNFLLIGISSHENDYRVSWAINQSLKMEFKRTDNIQIHNPRLSDVQEFSLYRYTDSKTHLHYDLFSNRCDNGFFLEEMKNIDYILKISGEVNKNFATLLVNKLKKIDLLTTAFAIDPLSLKSKKKLIF